MQLEIDKNHFKEMLKAAMLYSWVYGGLADGRGENFTKFEKLEKYLLKKAQENNLKDSISEFDGGLLPSDELCEELEATIAEYEDDSFWSDLTVSLGKRDFFRDATEAEMKEMSKTQWLPERAHDFYEKYEEEFKKHGIDRLEIKNVK